MGLTLALELRNYMKIAHPGVSISKPGYLKQRMKLNPDVYHMRWGIETAYETLYD